MNIYVFLGLFVALIFTLQTPSESRGTGNFLDSLINSSITNIIHKLPDSIDVETYQKCFQDSKLCQGCVNLTNIQITGLKTLECIGIHSTLFPPTIFLKLKLSEFIFSSDYCADMECVHMIPIYGNGRISIAFKELVITFSSAFSLPPHLRVHKVNATLHIDSAVASYTGLLNNEDLSALVSSVFNDVVWNFVNENSELVTRLLSPRLEDIINRKLNGSSKAVQQTYREMITFEESLQAPTFEDYLLMHGMIDDEITI